MLYLINQVTVFFSQVLSNERDNVTVRLEPDVANRLCRPAEFMVSVRVTLFH